MINPHYFSVAPSPQRRGGGVFSYPAKTAGGGVAPVNGAKVLSKDEMDQIMMAALSLPYIGEWDAERQEWAIRPEFEGLNNYETLTLQQVMGALRGNEKAIDRVFDRAMGKPKQHVESKNVNMGYTDYLKVLSQQIESGEIVDVEAEETITLDDLG